MPWQAIQEDWQCIRCAVQVPAAPPICKLSSVNLARVADPTFHIARFYPTITRCDAPFTLVWQVRLCLPPKAVLWILARLCLPIPRAASGTFCSVQDLTTPDQQEESWWSSLPCASAKTHLLAVLNGLL